MLPIWWNIEYDLHSYFKDWKFFSIFCMIQDKPWLTFSLKVKSNGTYKIYIKYFQAGPSHNHMILVWMKTNDTKTLACAAPMKTKKCFEWKRKYDVLELAHAHARDNHMCDHEMDIKQMYRILRESVAIDATNAFACVWAQFTNVQCGFWTK